MLVVEDLPELLRRVDGLLSEIDRDPHLILIEARILEIRLDEDEAIGIDWETLYDNGSFGERDLAGGGAGFFFDQVTTESVELLGARPIEPPAPVTTIVFAE